MTFPHITLVVNIMLLLPSSFANQISKYFRNMTPHPEGSSNPDGIPALQPLSSLSITDSSEHSSERSESGISGERLSTEPRLRPRPRRSRGESMRAGSKEAQDFFGRERVSMCFAGASSTSPDVGDISGERPSTVPRHCRSRVGSIQAGSKCALNFFGGCDKAV